MIEVKKEIDSNHREYKNHALKTLKPREKIGFYAPYQSRAKELSLLGWAIASNLVKITGIESILFGNGLISVVKGAAFDWKNLEPQLIYVLETLIENRDIELSFENKKEKPRFVEVRYLHCSARKYHLNRIVYPGIYWDKDSTEDLESPIKEVVEKLLSSSMIDDVNLRTYSIEIKKKLDYGWDEVEDFISSVLEELLASY